MMPLWAIAALAAGTLAFRLAGPFLHERVHIPDEMQRLLAVAATVLLAALVATAAFTQDHGFPGWARPAGVAMAAVLVIRKASFPIVVIAAAGTTALLRLAGVA